VRFTPPKYDDKTLPLEQLSGAAYTAAYIGPARGTI